MPMIRKRIRNLKPTFVSLLPSGANLLPGLLKSADGEGVEIVCQTKAEIRKSAEGEPTEGLLHSLVYVPDVEDAHMHFMGSEDIQKACHAHARGGLELDLRHDCKPLEKGQAHVVENMILNVENDPRFSDTDHRGRKISHKGAWAQIIQIEDPALLKLAEAGELNEVSLYAPAGNFELVDEPLAVTKSAPDDSTMDLEKFLEALTPLFKQLGENIQASNKELAKSLTKSEDGDGDGGDPTDEPPLQKGVATYPNGHPKFDGDKTSRVDLALFKRRVITHALDQVESKIPAENLDARLAHIEKREAIAKEWEKEDVELGIGSPFSSDSILKTLGLDGDGAGFMQNEDLAKESKSDHDKRVDALLKEVNENQPEVV